MQSPPLKMMACPLPLTSSFNEHQLPTATSLSNLDAIMGAEDPPEAFLGAIMLMHKKYSVQELKSFNKLKTSRRRAADQARHSGLDSSGHSLPATLKDKDKAIQILPSAIQSCPNKVNKKVRFAEPPKRTTENKYITSLDLARPPVRPGRKAFLTHATITACETNEYILDYPASPRPFQDYEPSAATSPSTFQGGEDHQPRKKGKGKEFGRLRKPANSPRRQAIRVWQTSKDSESLQTLIV
jgi:hypothetical protein